MEMSGYPSISRPLGLFAVAGLLLGLSQMFSVFWWGAILGVAFFVVAASWGISNRVLIFGAAVAGTLKALGGFAFIWHAFPIVWLGMDNLSLQFLLVFLHWLSTAAFMGVGLLLPAVVARWTWREPRLFLTLTPLAWLLGEIAGSLLVSIWLLGPGGFIHIYIGHGYAGLPLAQFSLLFPVMALGGLYGLTYTAAFIGMSLVLKARRYALAPLVVLIALYLIYPVRTLESSDTSVVSIDTFFTTTSQQTPEGRAVKERVVAEAVQSALLLDNAPDIILLPEDSRLTDIKGGKEETLEYLRELAPDSDTLVVDSARVDVGDDQVALRAFYYDLKRNAVYAIDKQFLVPQGEYVTYPFRALLLLLGQSELLSDYDRNQNYIPGPLKEYVDFPPDIPSLMFCSDSSSPLGASYSLNEVGVRLLLHPLSHGRFRDPHLLEYQLSLLLRSQAIWNDVTIVTAGNMSQSRVYYPDGNIGVGEMIKTEQGWQLNEYSL